MIQKTAHHDLILGAHFLSKAGLDLKYSTKTLEWLIMNLGCRLIFSFGLTQSWVHCLFIWLNTVGSLPFHWLHCHGFIAFSLASLPYVPCLFSWLIAMVSLHFHWLHCHEFIADTTDFIATSWVCSLSHGDTSMLLECYAAKILNTNYEKISSIHR